MKGGSDQGKWTQREGVRERESCLVVCEVVWFGLGCG